VNVFLPTLKQLQYLVALQDFGHFGKAAEACFVTQSTLSAGIQDLEKLVGLQIVERTRRVVHFTSYGEQIVLKARRVLREAEDLADLARAAAEPLSGELRLSVIPTIAPFMLPRILPKLSHNWPNLRLMLREETSAAACDALSRGTVDCVLLALPYTCGDVDSEDLFQDQLYVAWPGKEPAPNIATPDTVDPARLLLLEDGHCLKDHAISACNRPDIRGESSMLATSLHTLVQMVENGFGVTMLPEMAISAGILKDTSIIAKPLQSANSSRTIALIWRKASPRIRDYRLLAEELRKVYAVG
jgi:LysR family transcriptional regulator, hydrogen peroxide-inducible genes activator